MIDTMPDSIATLVQELISRGVEVWLIGSRANPTDVPPKDWDIVAFGDGGLLAEFRGRPQVENLDLLIVFDGDQFECPWVRRSDGATKGGSLAGWEWRPLDENRAEYRATKPRKGDNFCVDISTKKAVRILGV